MTGLQNGCGDSRENGYHSSFPSACEKKRKTIAIDVDEVLAQFVKGVAAYHNDAYGTDFQVSDFHSYSFDEVWGGTLEESMLKVEQFFKSDYFYNLEVVPGAKEGIDKLSEKFDLAVVTSRQFYIEEETKLWLDKHFPNKFSKILFGNHWTREGQLGHGTAYSKREMCSQVGAAALVDDAPKYIDDTCNHLQKVILFDLNRSYGWSKHYVLPAKNAIRCTSWPEVVRELEVLA